MLLERDISRVLPSGMPRVSRSRGLWLAWERHRRSRELASALGIPICTLVSRQPYVLRAALLSLRTCLLLALRRPTLLFVQNPSMVLASVACALRHVFRYRLVVDRHSNFRLHELHNRAFKWRAFHALSRYTIRAADITIVTNEALRDLVERWGGRPFVLPDRIPDLSLAAAVALPGPWKVVFICSHEQDEPVREVLEAAARLPDVHVYITGNAEATAVRYAALLTKNVHLTGYLPEAEYQSLLSSCDAILALTSAPNTLLCGAYEAVALGKPLVLSNQAALVDYFHMGRVITDNTTEGLLGAIPAALCEGPRLKAEMEILRAELSESWGKSWQRFTELVDRLVRSGTRDDDRPRSERTRQR